MSEQEGQIFATDPKLEQALELVRVDHEEAKKFALDPEAYLKSRGVNTEGMKFDRELSDDELELAAGGYAEQDQEVAGLTVCASVGVVLCGSVGG